MLIRCRLRVVCSRVGEIGPVSARAAAGPVAAILAKLDPAKPKPEPLPPLTPGMAPSHGVGRRRR